MGERNYKIKYESVSQMEINRDETAQRIERLMAASLCANCKHQSECMYLLKASSPVIECELHECGLSSKRRSAELKNQVPSDTAEQLAADGPLGLCINCANLRVCRLPKHEGGVWHCEEYS